MRKEILFLFSLLVGLSTSFRQHVYKKSNWRSSSLNAIDEFVLQKLESIRRTFSALTERLADPDLANDRKEMLVVSRERSAMEPTVVAYDLWKSLEIERLGLVEMEQDASSDADIKEMAREV
jgi:protein subunit release factor A